MMQWTISPCQRGGGREGCRICGERRSRNRLSVIERTIASLTDQVGALTVATEPCACPKRPLVRYGSWRRSQGTHHRYHPAERSAGRLPFPPLMQGAKRGGRGHGRQIAAEMMHQAADRPDSVAGLARQTARLAALIGTLVIPKGSGD